MAAISGKSGLVTWNSQSNLAISQWDASIDQNILDVTVFTTGTVQWRDMAAGLSGATVSFRGFFDTASTGQIGHLVTDGLAGTSRTVKLEVDKTAGGGFTGTAYVANLSPSVDIDGTADLAGSFTFDGAVTYTTST